MIGPRSFRKILRFFHWALRENRERKQRKIERLIAINTENRLKECGLMKGSRKYGIRDFHRKYLTVQEAGAIMKVGSRKKKKKAEIYKIHRKYMKNPK